MLFELSTNARRAARHRDHRFSLPETLDCGQCFRWQRLESGAYRGSAYGKSLTVSMDEKGLLLQGAAEEDFQALWRSYFDLDLDYNKIRGALANKDPILKEAAASLRASVF